MKIAKLSVFVLACTALIMCESYCVDAKTNERREVSEIFILDSINSECSIVNLGISSGVANSSCKVRGKLGTSKIELTMSLQKKSPKSNDWTTIKSWSSSSKSTSLTMEKSYKLISKGTYRCLVKAEITKDGLTEISTSVSRSKTY